MEITSVSGNFFRVDRDDNYYYVVGSSGCVILGEDFYQEKAYITRSGGFTDISTNNNTVFSYLTTSGDGVFSLEKDLIKKYSDLSNKVSKEFEHILDNKDLLCIDVLSDADIVLGGVSGIQIIQNSNLYYSNYYYPVTTVKFNTNGDVYYGGDFGLAVKKAPIYSNWYSPDFLLNKDSAPGLTSTEVNDIDVLVCSGYNLLTVATSSGVTIIKELSNVGTSSAILLYRS